MHNISQFFFFNFGQKRSIGLRSGEYGGRKISVHPAFFISALVISDLCIEALSIITICPGFRFGISMFSSQKLNNFASQVHVYPNGAKISFPHFAATIDCRANLRLDTSPIIFCLSVHAHVLCVNTYQCLFRQCKPSFLLLHFLFFQ